MPSRDDSDARSALDARALASGESSVAQRLAHLATVTPLRRRTVVPTPTAPLRRGSTVPTSRVRRIRTSERCTGAIPEPRVSAPERPTRAQRSVNVRGRTPRSALVEKGSTRLQVAAEPKPPKLPKVPGDIRPARPNRRMAVLLAGLLALFSLLAVRLAYVQGISAPGYAARGTAQRKAVITLAAERGSIFDRNGTDLALSVPAKTIYADPSVITDPAGTAAKLAALTGVDQVQLLQRLSQRDKRFVYVARKVDVAIADQVNALGLPGVGFVSESKRYYPGGNLAAPVMGFVGTDNNGLSGLETAYDAILTGKPGQLVTERDPKDREIPTGTRTQVAAVRGQDLVLTLDQSMQYEAERVLTEEVAQTNAKGGMAMIADVHTGEILAMVTINGATDQAPAQPAGPTDRNRTVTDAYEPGSTNKVITMAAALESGIATPDTTYQVPMQMRIGDATFEDHDPHGLETWTTSDILRQSSNIGTIMIARQIGKTKLDQYLRTFGFGKTTSLGLPGETPGLLLAPDKYSLTSMGTVPIGNGLAVTPAQMLSVYMTVANGGTTSPLRLVSATVDSQGHRKAAPVAPSTRVISAQTAAQLRAMLGQVVDNGTGTLAAIPGYTVAGKTGTARKPPYDHPPYRYMASFAGFAPADNPRLAAIVVLDEPQTEIFGGRVAAPAFSRMMAYALRAAKVPTNAATSGKAVVNAMPAPQPPAGATNATPANGMAAPAPTATTGPRSGSGTATATTSLSGRTRPPNG